MVRTEGIEPNHQPPCILWQMIYSHPQGTARIFLIHQYLQDDVIIYQPFKNYKQYTNVIYER